MFKMFETIKKKKENKNDYDVISKFYDVPINKEKNVNKIECYDGNHIICPECNKNHIKNNEIGGQCCGKCNIF